MVNLGAYILIGVGILLILFSGLFVPSKSHFQGAGRFPVREKEDPNRKKIVKVLRIIGLVILLVGGYFIFF